MHAEARRAASTPHHANQCSAMPHGLHPAAVVTPQAPPHPHTHPTPTPHTGSQYLSYIGLLNQVVMMGTQLYHDATVPQHHKYAAHQIALLYVSTSCTGLMAGRAPHCLVVAKLRGLCCLGGGQS